MREYYDLWDRFSGGLGPAGLAKARVRRVAIHAADRYLLTRNVSRLFVQSRTIQQRLAMWPELRSDVLYPPAPQRAYRCDEYGDYVFMVSRLTALKRADLLVQALGQPEAAGIRAVLAGDGEERDRLGALVTRLGLEDRVTLAGRITEAELLGHLARCRAVCFPPYRGGLRVRHHRSLRGAQGRRHLPRQRRAGRARRGRRQRLHLRSDAAIAGRHAAACDGRQAARRTDGRGRVCRGVEAELGGHGAVADVVNCTQCFAYLSNTEGTEGTESLGS